MNQFVKPSVPTIRWDAALADRDDPRLYLLNMSKKIVLIQVRSPNGENVVIQLPSTWIPVDVSLYNDREYTLRSPGFRSIAEAGLVAIVPSSAAQNLFENYPLAASEQRRLEMGAELGDVDIDLQAPKTAKAAPQNLDAVSTSGEPVDSMVQDINTVNARVQDLIMKLNEGVRSEDDTINLLMNVALADIDIRHITGTANSEKVRQFAAAQGHD